jgi:molybdopterin molybdotransferase
MLTDKLKTQASCADDFDSEALTLSDARQRILARITPVKDIEKQTLHLRLNRVLAQDIISTLNVPGHTNSAMDGYALAGDDLPQSGPCQYSVAGTAFAGKPFKEPCPAGQCVRIMTGAVMPDGTDTVVMQEHVEHISDTQIRVAPGHKQGQNVRQAGEDIAKDSIVLTNGHYIHAADLGVMASIGIGEIEVYRKPRIAFFSTGDELRPVGDALCTGDIYDSNRYSLHGMLSQLNVEIIDLGIVKDNPEDLRQAFENASADADLVITTGGVSVGEADYVKQIVETMGEIHIWKIAMKPGRPITFGRLANSAYFGLPGNPVSVMTTFYQFVVPAIQRVSGQADCHPLTIKVISTSELKKRAGRFEYQRGILSLNDAGQLTVCATGKQGSGILTSMSRANCLILLDENCDGVETGDSVTVQPLNLYL